MTETSKFYKVTGRNGQAYHGGTGTWPLPKGKKPGKWWKVDGTIKPCINGLHLCRETDLVDWLGPVIWEAEARGHVFECKDKVVVSEARLVRRVNGWNETTARLFACDCAERALEFNDDPRLKECVDVARKYAGGDDTYEEMRAYWADAIAATGAATIGPSCHAAMAATGTAAWTARAAAGRVAGHATWATGLGVAQSAEKEWQKNRLFEYLTGAIS